MKNYVFTFLLLFGITTAVTAQTTKIYIVRHAEKDQSDPSNKDPELLDIGKTRANALLEKLGKNKFSAIYSTDFKRTKSTVAPLAEKNKLEIIIYNPGKPMELVEKIMAEQNGKTVLIVGHSNTILELTEALGASRPLKEIDEESDYDNLILVTIKDKKAIATAERYGAFHHVEN